ncbi:carbonic anhydrase [Anaeroplasma bactoclasticum]|jgi:carbonic anhydrase|uniref:Carbonic anhydrase n=1 Tax=Anaeroplasma bactoclasticum TaxID=2088 RepID=A0A397RZ00_9MOLU|nr:carbonic anhydrase [Anaeroplasma bactoclasticum]RIA78502.1 carbonic anhydrase [Anaeroplasma bactoclasticum]
MNKRIINKDLALSWLIEGNNDYMDAKQNHHGDISKEIRSHTHHHGQNPFAIIVSCSDSRVIPENIFMKGIGDLFVIRVAGNVLDDYGLASIEYALDHLDCKLIMVLGHTKCGAIGASLEGTHPSYIGLLTNHIKESIGNTMNPTLACKKNVLFEMNRIKKEVINNKEEFNDVLIVGGIYHTSTGKVQIL